MYLFLFVFNLNSKQIKTDTMINNGISNRLKQLRSNKGLTIRGLADKVGLPFGTYAGYEYYANRKIPMPVLEKIADILNTPIDFILNGPQDALHPQNNLVIFVDKDSQNERIAYIPIVAQAGYLKNFSDQNYLENLATYSLPGFNNGTYRMFPIEGDSMLPTYFPGDILICVYVQHYSHVKDGNCYVIVSTEGICVKRCINAISKRGAIIIESDNMNYKPDLIPIESIIEIWHPKSRITKN